MTDKCRSWFCVWNNPQECYPNLEPNEIAEKVLEIWISEHPTRTGAVAYCISESGLIHLHMVLEDSNQARFSTLKKLYPHAHLEPTKGTKEQAEDYINKRGKFVEKGEQVLYIAKFGEIKGSQGQRKDLEIIQDYIEQNLTPSQIMAKNISYRRYEKVIKDTYFDKRYRETPFLRDINTVWHVGESASGKTYSVMKLIEDYGEENIYFVSDYDNGGLDKYNGEPYLFLDEFRGQIKYSVLLGMLQGYKQQFHARYTNVIGLWNEVHISTVLPPEKVYQNMVNENQNIDTLTQLFRRINTIVFHWKDEQGYHTYEIPMSEYIDYEDLKNRAWGRYDFKKVTDEEQLVFDV